MDNNIQEMPPLPPLDELHAMTQEQLDELYERRGKMWDERIAEYESFRQVDKSADDE